jgi:hypothetical protein
MSAAPARRRAGRAPVAALSGVYRLLFCQQRGSPTSIDGRLHAGANAADTAGEATAATGTDWFRSPVRTPDEAPARTGRALPIYRCIGDVIGQAGCKSGDGDLSRAKGDKADAKPRYHEALEHSRVIRIHRTDGVAQTRERLTSATMGTERTAHVQAARYGRRSTFRPANRPDGAVGQGYVPVVRIHVTSHALPSHPCPSWIKVTEPSAHSPTLPTLSPRR